MRQVQTSWNFNFGNILNRRLSIVYKSVSISVIDHLQTKESLTVVFQSKLKITVLNCDIAIVPFNIWDFQFVLVSGKGIVINYLSLLSCASRWP